MNLHTGEVGAANTLWLSLSLLPHRDIVHTGADGRCSQRSGGPTGPEGRTVKSPRPDWTAKGMSFSSSKSKEGRCHEGRRARQLETSGQVYWQ